MSTIKGSLISLILTVAHIRSEGYGMITSTGSFYRLGAHEARDLV